MMRAIEWAGELWQETADALVSFEFWFVVLSAVLAVVLVPIILIACSPAAIIVRLRAR